MNVCVIDIGSNTVKATVFSINSSGIKKAIGYKGFKAKLITYVKEENGEKVLDREGVNILYDAIRSLIAFAEENLCENVYAFATASLRGLANAAQILQEIYNMFLLNVDILSGEEEALCSLKGLLNSECCVDLNEGIMVDMGGGSTELVYFRNGSAPVMKSLPFGCLSLYSGFVKGNIPTVAEESEIINFVNKVIYGCNFAKSKNIPMFLIGGSGRAIGKVVEHFFPGKRLKADGSDFTFVIGKLRDTQFFDIAESIIPGRSATVVPASIAYRCLCEYVSPSSILISDSGVREGYLEKILP